MTAQFISENAAYHAKLLKSISELNYAPSALTRQASYVEELESELEESNFKLEEFSKAAERERREHESLRDSTGRRLAHKLTGRKDKFKEMETREEREYVEALEMEFTERERKGVLSQILTEAKEVNSELSAKAIQFESLQAELSSLYGRVFDGPTSEFPEDDRLQDQFHSSQSLHNQIQNTLYTESQAASFLSRADEIMNECRDKMQEAIRYSQWGSQWDMWAGGTMSDAVERNTLRQAQSLATQAEMLCQQAQSASPFVQSIGRLTVAQGSLMSDEFFDEMYTDIAFHRKIRESAADLARAHTRLQAERDAAIRRADTAGLQLNEASQALEESRTKLNDFRQRIFQDVAPQDSVSATEHPPSYHAPDSTSEVAKPTSPPETEPPSYFHGGISSPSAPTHWGNRNPYTAALSRRDSDGH